MMKNFGLLYNVSGCGLTDVWFKFMGESLSLVPLEKADALIAVANEHEQSYRCLRDVKYWTDASYDEPGQPASPESVNGEYDHLPLFIVWGSLNYKQVVQEYAPVKNGTRKLVKVYK